MALPYFHFVAFSKRLVISLSAYLRIGIVVAALVCLPGVALAAPWREPPSLSDLNLTALYQREQDWLAAEATRQEVLRQAAAAEAAAAAQESTAPAREPEQTYRVRPGDTLYAIASRYGTTVNEIMSRNNLSSSLIRVGQTLQIGGEAPQVHTVRRGESLSVIAAKYRVSVSALAKANGISQSDVIYPGQQLTIPAAAAGVSRAGSSSLRLRWPVMGTVTSGWGYRTRFEKFHYGLDVAAPVGTPIRAVQDGVVQFAGWKPGYGYCVFLTHSGGLSTAYGHASELYVKTGQRVSEGQTIAAVGSSGFSTGPHLHFEVRINGKLVNPALYLPK